MLPDNVFLEIFVFYRDNSGDTRTWKWHLLVHVCRRWRHIVFASPLRLNLRIFCTSRTSVEKNLSIWPSFPIDIEYHYSGIESRPRGEDNVIAALKHRDRVCDLSLDIKGSQFGRMVTEMKKPFPVLTHLRVRSDDRNVPIVPKEFLGRSAPCLQKIGLFGIPYPALPALLPSANNLVTLELHRIPPTGYISPQAMATCLAVLPRLDTFEIRFQSAAPRPGRIHLPISRAVLPALTSFDFKGASEYLEDLLAHINSPQLNRIFIVYLNQFVDFQVAQLSKFIDRSVALNLEATPIRHVQVVFSSGWVSFDMCHHENHLYSCRPRTITVVSCRGIDQQVSHIAQVLSQFSATLSNVVRLKFKFLDEPLSEYHQLEGADDVQWLHLLHQFSAVQTLYVSGTFATHATQALEDIAQDMVADVLPSLEQIHLKGQPVSSVQKFFIARQLSGHPVNVVNVEMEMERERERERAVEVERRKKKRMVESFEEWERERERGMGKLLRRW